MFFFFYYFEIHISSNLLLLLLRRSIFINTEAMVELLVMCRRFMAASRHTVVMQKHHQKNIAIVSMAEGVQRDENASLLPHRNAHKTYDVFYCFCFVSSSLLRYFFFFFLSAKCIILGTPQNSDNKDVAMTTTKQRCRAHKNIY